MYKMECIQAILYNKYDFFYFFICMFASFLFVLTSFKSLELNSTVYQIVGTHTKFDLLKILTRLIHIQGFF